MPELPEVETIRRQLEKLVVGKTISSIEVLNPGSFRAETGSLIGKSLTGVGRKGKVLIFALGESQTIQNSEFPGLASRPRLDSVEDGSARPRAGRIQNLFVHLKMSGQLEFLEGAKRSNLAANRLPASPKLQRGEPAWQARLNLNRYKHLRVCLIFGNKDRLLFHDQRKFGWITNDPAVLPPGIDALDPALSSNLPRQRRGKLAEILASSNRPVKTILLDQSKIAGIGNIYASEILWQAKINPGSKGPTLRPQGRTLIQAITKILTDAIDSGGSTMNDQLYRHVSGNSGDYWSRRRVYDRAGEPCHRPACRRKKALIRKITIGQRSTYFCPNCQR